MTQTVEGINASSIAKDIIKKNKLSCPIIQKAIKVANGKKVKL